MTRSACTRTSVFAAGRASIGSTAGASRRYQRSVPSTIAWIAARCGPGTWRARASSALAPSASTVESASAAPRSTSGRGARGPLGAARCAAARACSSESQPVDALAVSEIRGADRAPVRRTGAVRSRVAPRRRPPATALTPGPRRSRERSNAAAGASRACARQILSGSPRSEVCATGQGLQPLTWRAMSRARPFQSISASRFSSFAA